MISLESCKNGQGAKGECRSWAIERQRKDCSGHSPAGQLKFKIQFNAWTGAEALWQNVKFPLDSQKT